MAALIAAERATFILTSGERKSGPVVFHGGQRENLINGHLNLGDDNGKEMTFPTEQVALIQFVGGQPPPAELEALPADNSQVLIRRNGAVERGRFINLIGGDSVKWRAQNGGEQMIPIADVTRIYLNPDSARTTYNVTTRQATGRRQRTRHRARYWRLARCGWTPVRRGRTLATTCDPATLSRSERPVGSSRAGRDAERRPRRQRFAEEWRLPGACHAGRRPHRSGEQQRSLSDRVEYAADSNAGRRHVVAGHQRQRARRQ